MEEGRGAHSTELGSSYPGIGSQSRGQDKKPFIKPCSKADWEVWERMGRERKPSRVQSLVTVLQKATVAF